MPEIMDRQTADEILRAFDTLKKAEIFRESTQNPFGVQKVVLDLSVARDPSRPYPIGFAFKSFYVQKATDVLASVNMRPTTVDSFQSSFTVKQNDSWNSDRQTSGIYIDWVAQPGKSMEIIFFTNSEFRSGSQISVTGGGVSIVEGSTFSQAALTFVPATPLLIFASDSTRKVGIFQNKTGASVWIGGASVTNSTAFYEVIPGAELPWKNTAALYGFSLAGGVGHKTEEF